MNVLPVSIPALFVTNVLYKKINVSQISYRVFLNSSLREPGEMGATTITRFIFPAAVLSVPLL